MRDRNSSISKKVMVAMSGGVDSSVAAYLLRKMGYEIAGATMCIGVESRRGQGRTCCSPRDIDDAAEVCRVLNIPHYVLDFSDEMERMVIGPFIEEYLTGRTPNPCIRCNEYLKFGLLLDRARESGFDFLATGHYCRTVEEGNTCYLEKPADRHKDQTYFLYSISGERLRHVLFPISGYLKDDVRDIAMRAGIPVFQKPDSQDICFFPAGGSYEFFNSRGIKGEPGDIIHVNGKRMGRHKGIIYYTIGQRRGLGIGHTEPLYVISIDALNNSLIVGERGYLKSTGLIADVVRLPDNAEGEGFVKIRYAHQPAGCRYRVKDGELKIIFNEPQDSVTPGQSVVLYDNSRVTGGGIIKRVLD